MTIKELLVQIKQLTASIFGLRKELRKKNEEMVICVCKEKGLSLAQGMEIRATVFAESQFDSTAYRDNNDGAFLAKNYPVEYQKYVQQTGRFNSRDAGICQFNDFWWYYYKGNKRIHPNIAQNDPETAVRIMIDAYRNGEIKAWHGYKSKLFYDYYKKFSGVI